MPLRQSIPKPERDRIIAALGELPVWGVVSTYSTDAFYGGLTYKQALRRKDEEDDEDDRESRIVLCV